MGEIHYHPDPFSVKEHARSYRKVQSRLKAMLRLYDFYGKSVLDIGCNDGYFSFKLGRYAKDILAIDADEECIRNNIQKSQRAGIANIRFEKHAVSPELIDSLGQFDVALFLSVFHHMVCPSGVYACNTGRDSGMEYGLRVLRSLRSKTQVLFFEMGQSDETGEWARHLPDMGKDPARWIVKELLEPSGFRGITIIEPPDWSAPAGPIRRFVHGRMDGIFSGGGIASRILRRAIAYDTRDCRYMFMAKGAG